MEGSKNVIIYIDILVCCNLLLNYLLLLSASQYTFCTPKKVRVILSSVLGGLYSIISIFPGLPFFIILTSKILCCYLMCLIAFGHKNILRNFFIFLAYNLLFSGLMLILWVFVSPSGMNFHNGIVYFNISTPVLIISTIIAYMFINIYTLITKKVPIPVVDYDVIIEYKEKEVTVKGFVDTGNFLSDIFSSTPVVICNISALKDILPEEVVVKLTQTDYLYDNYDDINSIVGIKFRIIPYSTISGHRLLPAFKPDKFILRDKNRAIGIDDVYIGLSNELISNRDYDIILNPMILK